ncbi:hypothetical protein DHW03_05660 [Pedobacter yonginense]|uniref:Uncharacterized protein n=1 Tax=Pedobacter yonginense TaxID=651869 RepID=A0A317ETS8_9SPHI|nr:hypothetical protein [Pedobacter yonginense]PWS29303.1 hypothetical protein DHW03_05660 [Pedobacter yonginense]
MKKLFFLLSLYFSINSAFAQFHDDKNLLKTSTINLIWANGPSALRYEVANLAYNSHHWQNGGIIVVELFQKSYSTDYQKYIIENGFQQGANSGSPKVTLVESKGIKHLARVILGDPISLGTEFAGYPNYSRSIYVDCFYYSQYVVKISYLQDRVDNLTGHNQIKINLSPIGTAIEDFTAPTIPDMDLTTSGNLKIEGTGNHYVMGNVGIGTTTPKEKLAVNGNIRAKEVKVETANWPDYVFEEGYKVSTLQQLETYIKTNKHLPEMPSAKEAEKDGIDLGEMNKKLLQKVEELTLYMIEMKKENEQLKKRVEAVERTKK